MAKEKKNLKNVNIMAYEVVAKTYESNVYNFFAHNIGIIRV